MSAQKKTLLELMVEAGIQWPEGAEYAAQDKDTMRVRFYRKGKPLREFGVDYWSNSNSLHSPCRASSNVFDNFLVWWFGIIDLLLYYW